MANYYGTDGNDGKFNGFAHAYGGDGQDALGSDNNPFYIVLEGGFGDDTLYINFGGQGGNFYGGDGNDWLFSSAGNTADWMFGGFDNDILQAGSGNDYLEGGQGFDALLGEDGDDHLYGGDDDDRTTLTIGVGAAVFGAGFSTTHAGGLYGGNGNDYLDGGRGSDSLFGDADDDQLYGGDGHDTLDGGTGRDILYGGTGIDQLYGGDDDDELSGDSGTDYLDGGFGADVMMGGGDDDTYIVDDPFDLVFEAQDSGDDWVYAYSDFTLGAGQSIEALIGLGFSQRLVGNELGQSIIGSVGVDALFGGGGADILDGSVGTDLLTGGFGKDTQTGGVQNDIFDFNHIAETGKTAATRDVITDFTHAGDRIDLSTIDASTKHGGNQKFVFIGAHSFHHKAGELRYVKTDAAGVANDKVIVMGDVNGDGRADFQIELSGLVSLSKGDFIL